MLRRLGSTILPHFQLCHRARKMSSLFDPQLQRCPDSEAVLRAGSSSRLIFSLADLQSFFSRLRALGKMPNSGGELRDFVRKVEESLPSVGAEGASLALSSFADLRCRQGALVAWPMLQKHLDKMPPDSLVESIWAISAIPNPPREVTREVVGIIRRIPRPADLSERTLYRSLYGLARISRGRGCEVFSRRAVQALGSILGRSGPCVYSASQLVRVMWSIARLDMVTYEVLPLLEKHLRNYLPELSERELKALYGVLTDLRLEEQWQLIFDVERAMRQREESSDVKPDKAARKQPFRRKWIRPSIIDSVLKPSKNRRQ